jgi:CheY-like chemotaxis protein
MADGHRILAADDDPDTAEFYREALARLGHLAVVVGDGLRLVESCRSVKPDLVVTDVRMPGLDGVGAVRQIWAERPVPVVLVTACDPALLPELDPQGNFLLVLRKPGSLSDLERAIASAFRSTQGVACPPE